MKYLYFIFLFLGAGAIFAPYLSIHYFAFFQLLSLGLPIFLLILILIFVFLKKENNKMRWLTVGFILLTIIALRKEITFSFSENTQKEDFSLLTYNVQNFGYNKKKKEEILAFIKKQDNDFVCLQEFFDFRKRPNTTYLAAQETAQKLAMPYYIFPSGHTHITGIAFFSKYPILKIDTLFMDRIEPNTGILATLQTPKGKLGVACLHLSSFRLKLLGKGVSSKWDYIWAVWDRWTEILALQQQKVEKIKTITQKYPYPFILAGDFNANPEGRIIAEISEGLEEAFQEKGNGFSWTYPFAKYLGIKIDNQFHTPDLKVLDCQVLKTNLSDHYPLTAKYKYYTNKKESNTY